LSSRGPLARALAALLFSAFAAGCLGDDEDPGTASIEGRRLVDYTSLPRSGPMAGVACTVAAGQRQALAGAGSRAGRYRVRLVELGTTSAETGPGDPWDPGAVSESAARAVRNPRTIAYLGELGLGASAVSVPITNQAGILQVSPGDGLTGLSRRLPRTTARPERYYPSGRRTFVRLVPDDLTQARRLATRMEAWAPTARSWWPGRGCMRASSPTTSRPRPAVRAWSLSPLWT
jgi:branched-chain amino acid transport system substrate-binding protein